MQSQIINRAWVIICIIFIASYTTGCGPTGYIEYGKPDVSLQGSKSDLIGKDKTQILDLLGSPDDVFTKLSSTSYYVYTIGEGKALPFFLMIPVPLPEKRIHCLLLEFDESDVLQDYYVRIYNPYEPFRSVSSENCSAMVLINEIQLTKATEGTLLHELKLDNAVAQWELYKQNKSHGEFDYELLCKSAESGNYRAQWELAFLHSNGGFGVRKDLVLSAMWYRLVESAGYNPIGVDTILEQLTPSQRIEVENLYKSWKPGQCEREIFGTTKNSSN